MGGRVQIFLKIGNTDLFHRGNLKDCLIDKNINPPDISDISLAPALSYFGNKTRMKFNGSCLKQNQIAFACGKTVNIYTLLLK